MRSLQCNWGQDCMRQIKPNGFQSLCCSMYVYGIVAIKLFDLTWLQHNARWCHQMETLSALQTLCAGNSPVTGEFPAQRQWRGALMFSLICAWINGWVNKPEAGELRRHRAPYDVTVMVVYNGRKWQGHWGQAGTQQAKALFHENYGYDNSQHIRHRGYRHAAPYLIAFLLQEQLSWRYLLWWSASIFILKTTWVSKAQAGHWCVVNSMAL